MVVDLPPTTIVFIFMIMKCILVLLDSLAHAKRATLVAAARRRYPTAVRMNACHRTEHHRAKYCPPIPGFPAAHKKHKSIEIKRFIFKIS